MPKKNQPTPGVARPDLRMLLPYATDTQRRIVEAIEQAGSHRAAAELLGVADRNVNAGLKRLRETAARYGIDPKADAVHPVPLGQKLRGQSTLYKADGSVALQWVKTSEDREQQARILREHCEALAEDLPKYKPIKASAGKVHEDLLAVLPMGDPHFGMYAWAAECGDSFDLEIARRDLCAAVDYLVRQTPRCGRCLIANLGDFFHADNMSGMTTASGNVLDMDTRLPKMYRIGVAALRQCIDTALKRHSKVDVINAVGNHDEVLSFTLSILLAQVYEDEPRVVIHDQPTKRHYLRHGQVLIGVTHGHQTKDPELPGIMATERAEDWGQTKYRYFYRGHHHHDARKEYNGAIVQQFRTLAASDSYAVAHGYLAGRDMRAILMHKDHGQMTEYQASIDMLRELAAA